MRTYITPEEARATVLAKTEPIAPVEIRLSDALGRILQEDVQACEDVPPFDNSAMDGFAVCEVDLKTAPVKLKIAGEIAAGSVPRFAMAPGSCVRIMTGAPTPGNAAAIVPVEWTLSDGPSHVVINRLPAKGQYIRRAGQDMERGHVVLEAGTRLTPPAIGLIATAGHNRVIVSPIPRVAVIVTGDELYRASGRLPFGKIRDANGPALAAQVRHAGGSVASVLHARDEKAHVREVFSQAIDQSDMILLSGGVSVGNYDYVNEVLDEAGVMRHFWRVRQRPGGPLSFGTLGDQLVFGLPGNPVSSFVCFEQYVRRALKRLMREPTEGVALHEAALEAPVAKPAGLHHFVRGIADRDGDGQLHVRATGPQASNLYTSAAAANCLIHLPENMEHPAKGQAVNIEWLPWAAD